MRTVTDALQGLFWVNWKRGTRRLEIVRKTDRATIHLDLDTVLPQTDERKPATLNADLASIVASALAS